MVSTGNTLRDAVAYANTLGAGTHAITFDPTVFATSQTITLNSPLTLSDSSGTTIITGPAAGVILSGGISVGLFDVKAGVTATLSDLSLIDGKSSSGGAIVDQGTLTITSSTLSGNTTTGLGGAVVVTGSLTVVNSTLASNSAAGSGGAIENVGSVTVLDSTLSANQAGTGGSGSGGAIDNSGNAYTLTIGDSIVAGNSASSGPNVSNAVTSQGNNLIGATDGSSGWVSSDLTGTVATPLNPLLASLGNNGGPTPTMALLSGSPAIGAGASINGITTDQRGFPRPASGPDIGAYQSEALVTVTDAGGVYNGSSFPATAASATGTGGLNDTNLADFTFSYVGTGSTTYAASSTAPTNAGTYIVTATYLGNATHASSSSLATPFTISKAGSITTVTDAGGTHNGSPFPATAASATGSGGLNNTNLADFTFSYVGTGSTTYAASSTAPTNAGTFTVTATYSGDTNHTGSSSGAVAFTIAGVSTKTSVTSSASPAAYGQQITYTAAVTSTTGAVTMGSVQFIVDGANYGSPVALNTSGQALSSAISFLTGASHSVQAVYIPSSNFTASSASLNQVMQSIGVEGTALYIGSNGATSNDQVQINPIGSSNTGSTGVQVQTRLNGGTTTTNYSQALSAVDITLQNGNDNVHFNPALTLSAVVSGSAGNDNVQLGDGNNKVTLGNGGDSVQAGSGNNTVTVGNGNDSIQLGNGNNAITAGNGYDLVQLGNGNNTVMLGTGSDLVIGGNGNNTITAADAAGANVGIALGNGNNTISLGAGNDLVVLGGGNNVVTAGNGNDGVAAGGGANSIALGNGNDNVLLGGGSNTVSLGNGNDGIWAGGGNNTVTVGNGNDTTQLGDGSNVIVEGNGNDNVQAGNGANLVVGGLGRHTIQLGNGNNILIDGSATVVNAGDSLRKILNDWNASPTTLVNQRLKVVYNSSYPNSLKAGSGRDWFFYTYPKTTSNKKATDRLN